jgi:hypothetical protein
MEDHILGIHKCLDSSKQGENYEKRTFDTMGFIGVEKTLTPYNM